MDETRAGGYISKITFNNGQELEIANNDIVLLVGPNNAGKSQSLNDIYDLASYVVDGKVISEISVVKYDGQIVPLLEKITYADHRPGSAIYSVMGYEYNARSESSFVGGSSFNGFRNLFVANLNTSARLTICHPPQTIDRNAVKRHPIHYAVATKEYRKWLSDSFKMAFGEDLIPNTQFGLTVPLCIGEPVHLQGDYEDEQDRQEAYAKVLDTYKQVQNQGDGVKSFTGILLYLMLDYFCVYLIDEPESFLHPPQAKIMGQIIGQTLKPDQQAFIATHSEEIIKGLLETCPERIKIVRITREGDANSFSILDNTRFHDVWNDPLLKYSNIMSSLFHKTTVLCESDSDCKMYSIIESHIKQSEGQYSETLFVHCGGKARMAKVVKALRALDINVKAIPDIDVLNQEETFKGLVEAFDIDWQSICADFKILTSNIRAARKTLVRKDIMTGIVSLLNQKEEASISQDEIKALQEMIKCPTKWEDVKKAGTSAIPSGDAMAAYNRIESILREHNIFVVPVGELEGFVREEGGHGPSWVNKVLEKHPDLDDGVYAQITCFVRSIGL